MTTMKQRITIKGNKDGLQFRMDPDCSYHELIEELEQKLRVSHVKLLQGPLTHVHLHFGSRYVSPEQREEIREMIQRSGNLLVKEFKSDVISIEEAKEMIRSSLMKVEVGVVRSGQVLECKQDILILGDVNPGGLVVSDGNIYVMGALKGMAHAGRSGDRQKVIIASVMEPTQLRIANVISLMQKSANDEPKQTEFAYLSENRIRIDRIQNLRNIRPDAQVMISIDQ